MGGSESTLKDTATDAVAEEVGMVHRGGLRLLVTVSMTLALLGFNVAATEAQEELSAAISFGQSTANPRTGDATLSGTVTCSEPAFVNVAGELRQVVSRFHIIRSSVAFFVDCPGPQGTSYSVTVVAQEAKWAPGSARFIGNLTACADPDCIRSFFAQLDETFRLAAAR
jgi:hypothetical protein